MIGHMIGHSVNGFGKPCPPVARGAVAKLHISGGELRRDRGESKRIRLKSRLSFFIRAALVGCGSVPFLPRR